MPYPSVCFVPCYAGDLYSLTQLDRILSCRCFMWDAIMCVHNPNLMPTQCKHTSAYHSYMLTFRGLSIILGWAFCLISSVYDRFTLIGMRMRTAHKM
jgi:hypothetical protein